MNLVQINYLDKLSQLLREAFKFKKYKAMHPALAVFAGILMIPFVLASFSVAAAFAVLAFSFSVCTSPVKYLHTLVNQEGKEVKHATQAIVYLISWPFVFFLYAVMAVLLLMIIPTYALLSILLYVWSFGGFKFHLFMTETDNISIDVSKKYLAVPLIFVIVGYLMVAIIPFIHWMIGHTSYAMQEQYLADIYDRLFPSQVYSVYFGVYSSFAFVYSLITSPFPRSKKVEVKAKTDEE